MGWGRWFFLGDLGQQLDLADQQEQIESLERQLQSRQAIPSSVEERLAVLQRESDELKLYLAAVMRMMVAKKIATADEIKTLVTAVDREDGVQDKKHAGPIVPEA